MPMTTTRAPQVDAFPLTPRPWATATTSYLPLGASGTRWLNGVTFVPLGCTYATAQSDDDCGLVMFAAAEGFDDPVTFLPFRLEVAVECSAIGGLSPAELQEAATRRTEASRSALIARQVMWGAYNQVNPDLRNTADTATSSDTTPIGALAAVEDALAQKLQGALGMIHMTPGMLTRLTAGGGLKFSAGEYRTATGHIVVADAGYDGGAPGGMVSGQSWIYGSGMVRFQTTPVMPLGETWENFDFTHNDMTARVVQWALALFEPCPVVAARADAPTITV